MRARKKRRAGAAGAMGAVTWGLFYAVMGTLFLIARVWQETAFYLFPGMGFLALGAFEIWWSLRRRDGASTWRPSLSLALMLIAACYVYQGVADATGSNVAMAVLWLGLGAAHVVKLLRDAHTGPEP